MLRPRRIEAPRASGSTAPARSPSPRRSTPTAEGTPARRPGLRGFGRGPWGRRHVVMGGSRAWVGARVGAYPIAAGWGMGW